MREKTALGVSFVSTDGKLLGCKLGSTDGKLLVFRLEAVDGLKLGLYEGTDLGYTV